jgi:iron complex transport system permease protein
MKKRKQPDEAYDRIHLREMPEEPQELKRAMEQHSARVSPVIMLAIAVFCLFWVSLLLIVPYNQFSFTPAWVFSHVKDRFYQLYSCLFGTNRTFQITIFQYLAVILTGSALAACGTIFQGSFRNVLAGPSTMGVMSGGTIGCLVYLLLFTSSAAEPVVATADLDAFTNRTLWEIYGQQLSVLLGCFGGVGLTLLVATIAGRGKLSTTAMILSGTVLSTMSSNLIMLVQYYMTIQDPTDTRLDTMQDLMMGSFNGITTLRTLLLLGVPILLCLGVLMGLRGRLNLLSLGEEEATTMGLNVRFYRYLMIAIGTILTAVVVAFCGRIGFLGFMIPLVGRKLAGPDMRRLLPTSLLLGAILLLLVYDVAAIFELTDYLNLFTSSIGGIVMLITLFTERGGSQGAAFAKRGTAGIPGR